MTGRFAAALLTALCAAGAASAQAPSPAYGGRGGPLRQDTTDWWGDVHRWTGSDETRPRGRHPAPSPGSSTPPAEARTVVSSLNVRANIRAEPSLEAPVVRRAAPGTLLNLFGEAPGGWFQVGDTAPFGWIHRSVLQRAPAAE